MKMYYLSREEEDFVGIGLALTSADPDNAREDALTTTARDNNIKNNYENYENLLNISMATLISISIKMII